MKSTLQHFALIMYVYEFWYIAISKSQLPSQAGDPFYSTAGKPQPESYPGKPLIYATKIFAFPSRVRSVFSPCFFIAQVRSPFA